MKNINVLHLIGGSLRGGAARGAYWLFRELIRKGVEGVVLNNTKSAREHDGVLGPRGSVENMRFRTRAMLEQSHKLLHPNRERTSFNTGFYGIDVTESPYYRKADIVHLHWINQGFVKISTLPHIKKPLVWTFRDLWPGTGGCHYPMGCEKFVTGCSACPQLGSSKAIDLSSRVFANKRINIPQHLVGVGISNWVVDNLKQSPIFARNRIKMIPNAIPIESFFPEEQYAQRKRLDLPETRPIVLVGADSLGKFHKGFDLFQSCLHHLPKGVLILTFGHNDSVDLRDFDHRHLGFLSRIDELRAAYAAADVFVAPSRQEAFGKTLCESMASGTPVVAFDIGGPSDIIEHQVDGYLAKPYSPEDLANGIRWLLDENNRPNVRLAAIRKIRERFSTSVVAEQYIALYKSLLA